MTTPLIVKNSFSQTEYNIERYFVTQLGGRADMFTDYFVFKWEELKFTLSLSRDKILTVDFSNDGTKFITVDYDDDSIKEFLNFIVSGSCSKQLNYFSDQQSELVGNVNIDFLGDNTSNKFWFVYVQHTRLAYDKSLLSLYIELTVKRNSVSAQYPEMVESSISKVLNVDVYERLLILNIAKFIRTHTNFTVVKSTPYEKHDMFNAVLDNIAKIGVKIQGKI